jgi:hypothetical protein
MMAAALSALAAAAAPQELARTTVVAAPEGARVEQALLSDLDGDGQRDLLLVTAARGGPQRTLRLYRGHAEGARFGAAPDRTQGLTPDVVALAPGDVHADPGSELVLWSARGAFAWRPNAAEEAGRFVRLGEVDLLWQVSGVDPVLLWRAGVRDVDGDGLADLLAPEPGGYRVLHQSRGAQGASFAAEPLLALDPALLASGEPGSVRTAETAVPGAKAGGQSVSFSFGDQGASAETSSGPLLSLDDSVPAPQLLDWDGDGDLDCLAQTREELLVWRRGGEGGLERIPLPFKVDRGRKFDVSYAAAAAELDGDGRADCVIFAGDKRASDVRTQVLVFTHAASPAGEAPLFGDNGRPSQLLVLAGFAGRPRLDDVDGDGRPDLVVGAVRPDLLEAIAGGGETIELELDVFRNSGGRFSAKPDLAARVRVSPEALEGDGAARFVADVGGDGVRDLLVRGEQGLELHLVRPKRGGGLELLAKPVWTLALGEDDRVRIEAPEELLILGEDEVKHVELGR